MKLFTTTTNYYFFVVGPTFAQDSSIKNITEGGSITLDCSIQESNPPANVSFTTDANYRNVVFNPSTNMITISNAVLSNSGVYTCIANSTVATTTLRYTLNVES